jgi:hypothetical protein
MRWRHFGSIDKYRSGGLLVSPEDAMPVCRAYYLIIVEDCIVSQDLAESVSSYDPGAGLIVCRTMDEAVTELDHVDLLAVAFIEESPANFAASPLAEVIATRGGQVILIGAEAEEMGKASGWTVLERPFSSTMVLEHLAGLVPT